MNIEDSRQWQYSNLARPEIWIELGSSSGNPNDDRIALAELKLEEIRARLKPFYEEIASMSTEFDSCPPRYGYIITSDRHPACEASTNEEVLKLLDCPPGTSYEGCSPARYPNQYIFKVGHESLPEVWMGEVRTVKPVWIEGLRERYFFGWEVLP